MMHDVMLLQGWVISGYINSELTVKGSCKYIESTVRGGCDLGVDKWGIAILGLGAGRNQVWMVLLAFWCVYLQQSFCMCSLSPPASLWLLPSLPCAVSSMRVQQSHCLCPSFSLLVCARSLFSPTFFQFLQCTYIHIQHRVSVHNSSFLPHGLWLLCLYQCFTECSSRLEGFLNLQWPTHLFYPLTDASDVKKV